MNKFAAVLAGLNFVNLGVGFALGIVFGGKVRGFVAAGLEKLAGWMK